MSPTHNGGGENQTASLVASHASFLDEPFRYPHFSCPRSHPLHCQTVSPLFFVASPYATPASFTGNAGAFPILRRL